VRRGLLVGERARRDLRRLHGVLDRLPGAVEVAALVEVMGQLGRRPDLELLERLRDPVMQPDATAAALALVERVADERLREDEAVRVVGQLVHEARRRRLLQRGDDALDRLVHQRLEQLQPEFATDHRSHDQHLPAGRREPVQP
jgi:hypothetical protein